MGRFGFSSAALIAGALFGVASVAPHPTERGLVATPAVAPKPARKRRFHSVGGTPDYRSKNKAVRRKLRSNRLHVSRRTRRRHRRAA